MTAHLPRPPDATPTTGQQPDPSDAAPISVLIVDDHTLFRAGLRSLLADEPRIRVVGEASNGAEAIDACTAHAPAVVLMDVRMPGIDGIEASRRITERDPTIAILILTGSDSEQYVIEALRAGARGYILKNTPPESVKRAVIAAAAGEVVLAGPAAHHLVEGATGRSHDPISNLTVREREVLALVAEGVSNERIARQLGIHDKTVRNHVSRVYGKLGVKGRSQVLKYGVGRGLVYE